MADKPILFSAPMVRALLAGTKTQTRRVMKPQPEANFHGWWHIFNRHGGVTGVAEKDVGKWAVDYLPIAVGDRLWVRESWNWTHIADLAPGETLGRTLEECCEANGGFACPCGDGIVYAATNAQQHPVHGAARWKPSIHMPRWASRLTLTVTDVRVQRLHQIDGADARAEGTPCYVCGNPLDGKSEADCHCFHRTADASDYANLWNAINGTKEQPDPWSLNPWVAAYTFTVERCNIDQARAAA